MAKRVALFALVPAFLLLSGCSPSTSAVTESNPESPQGSSISFESREDMTRVMLDGKPLTTFHYNARWDKPFLHPIRTLSGVEISRGYPVDPKPGEENDHEWHRGIWYGHGDINGEDFWREQGRDKTSRLVLRQAPEISTSGSAGTLSADLSMITPRGNQIGAIQEKFTFSTADNNVYIDAQIQVAADHGVPLKFGDTDDGGFAFRLSDAFRQDRGANLINSAGGKGTEEIWGKPAKWVYYSAKVDGRDMGVAVFDHPSNLRHPTTWHARGYSLCSANPFGLKSFTGDKAKDGSYTVTAGETLTLRYRVIVHDGPFAPEEIEKAYARFATAQ